VTAKVMLTLVGFEWDDLNINHLGERGVADREVEQLLTERHVIVPKRKTSVA
jgi:hypothetical protein